MIHYFKKLGQKMRERFKEPKLSELEANKLELEIKSLLKIDAPHGTKDRIKSLLKAEYAQIHKSEAADLEPKKIDNLNFINSMSNLLSGKKWLTGAVSLVVLLAISLGSYPFIPAPKVQGYSIKNAVKEIPYNAPFKLIFSQPMNRSSVENNFAIEPQIEGKFEWNFNTVMFWPDKQPQIGETYKVTLHTDAKSLIGKNLETEYQEVFNIIEAPTVSFFTPSNSEEVEGDARISVMFNQPLLKLSTLEENEKYIPNIKIEPKLEGRWRWLGTSSLQFIPEHLPLATNYKVTIPKGIKTATDGETDQEFVFSFSTIRPDLLSAYPSEEFLQVNDVTEYSPKKIDLDVEYGPTTYGPDQDIVFTFNQPVELASLKEKLRIFSSEKEFDFDLAVPDLKKYRDIQGYYYDNEDGKESDEEKIEREKKVIIKTREPLPMKEVIRYNVEAGIESKDGDVLSGKRYVGYFYTAGPLAVKELSSWTDYASVYFNNPVNSKELARYTRLFKDGKEEKIEIDFGNEEDGSSHFIDFAAKPGEEYTLKIARGLKDTYGQSLDQDYEKSFRVPDLYPMAEIRTNNFENILDYNLEPEFFVKSVNAGEELTIILSEIDTENDGEYANQYGREIARISKKLANKKNETEYTNVNLNKDFGLNLKPGAYGLRVETLPINTNDLKNYTLISDKRIILTKTVLATKKTENKVLVWATDIETGQPVADMEIFAHLDNEIFSGKTNAEGISEININLGEGYYRDLLIIGKKAEDYTITRTNWSEGISDWNFNITSTYKPQKNYGYVYTDRPVYRPGDVVNFKAILRIDDGKKLNLVKSNDLKFSVTDPQYNNLTTQNLKLDSNGTVSGSFTIPKGGAVGQYSIKVFDGYEDNYEFSFYRYFSVAEYRRPEFKVSIDTDKTDYTNGDMIHAKIGAEYFFGGKMQGAPVDITVLAEDYYFNEYKEEWYNFATDDYICYWECPDGGSEMLTRVRKNVGEDGSVDFEYKTDIKEGKPSQILTVEANVVEPNSQQEISNRVYIPVHKGSFYAGIKSSSYLYKTDEEAVAEVISVDHDGNTIAGKNLKIELMKREWTSIKKQNIDGYYYYENDFKDEFISEKKVTTDKNGKSSASFGKIKDGGSYVFVVSANDENGNSIKASSGFYVTSGDYINWGRDNNDRIELIPDKQDYKVGETAKILIKSPYSGVKALLTMEKNDILERKIIDITTNSQTIELPIKEEYLPNFYVSVLIAKGGGSSESLGVKIKNIEDEITEIKSENEELINQIDNNIANLAAEPLLLEDTNQPLQDKLRSNKETLVALENQLNEMKAARDKLKNVSDNNDGIAAFKLGYAELKVETENKKLEIKMKTDKEKYLPGETVNVEINTLDINGNPVAADLSMAVVDESVLSLKEDVVHDLIGYFYGRRWLGVKTSHALTKFLNRVNVEVQSGLKGGGGGFSEDLSRRTRENFKDTAFWQANLKSDKDGKIKTSFVLPDNLTTWQILAVGNTVDSKLGSEKITIKTNKELLIRPIVPRFMSVNDELKVGLTIHNYSGEDIKAEASLISEGVSLMEGESSKIVNIKAEGETKLEWKIKAGSAKEAKFIFKVEDQGAKALRDEVVYSLPINAYTIPEYTATSGSIGKDENAALETIFIPSAVDKNLGELNINVAATLLGSVANGLEYLVSYPYGCAEQTASGLLPNLAIKQVLNLPQIDNDIINLKELDERVNGGIQRLYSYQKENGGFSIWQESEATMYLTAYILDTLNNAKKAGYQVDENVIVRAENYLIDGYYYGEGQPTKNPNDLLQSYYNGPDLNSMAYVVYVLSESGRVEEGIMNNLYDQREKLNLTGKINLALAMNNSALLKAKAKGLTDFVISKQKETSRGTHFEDNEYFNYYSFDSNAKLNALALKLINRVYPDSPILDKMLFYIRNERIKSAWRDTHASSQTILSLVEYIKDSGEFESEFFAKVIINGGESLDTAFFKKENFGEVKNVTVPMSQLLSDNSENEVQIARNGSGKVYYDILFKYYLPIELLEPKEEGFSITQNYYSLDDTEEKTPLKSLKYGENIKSKISLVVPDARNNVMVEDIIPAGLEIVDFSLKTSRSEYQELVNKSWNGGLWYFNHKEVRDDRLAYFADYLPAGVYELEYIARVTSEGSFADLPARVEEMYQPDVFARTIGRKIEAY